MFWTGIIIGFVLGVLAGVFAMGMMIYRARTEEDNLD